MTNIGDGQYRQGQSIWVIMDDGSERAAEYVGEGETSAWFGGPPMALVVFEDDRSGGAVEVDRIIPRDTE
jgi:hypothetical protein